MKKLFIMALLTASSLGTMAEDYKYLTAAYNSIEQSFELATVQKITFENDNVVITTSQGITNLPLSTMEKMFFSDIATAIESMGTESENLKMSNGLLHASGKGLLYIYNSMGQLTQIAQVDGEMNISLSTLPKGIYIVSLNDETIKISKQ